VRETLTVMLEPFSRTLYAKAVKLSVPGPVELLDDELDELEEVDDVLPPSLSAMYTDTRSFAITAPPVGLLSTTSNDSRLSAVLSSEIPMVKILLDSPEGMLSVPMAAGKSSFSFAVPLTSL
jgi:hypothetical protein